MEKVLKVLVKPLKLTEHPQAKERSRMSPFPEHIHIPNLITYTAKSTLLLFKEIEILERGKFS